MANNANHTIWLDATKALLATLGLDCDRLYCVKTGLPVSAKMTHKEIAKLNSRIKAGQIVPGVNPGRLLLSEAMREKCRAAGQWNGKCHKWPTKGDDGQYRVTTGGSIRVHNEQVIELAGYVAAVGTRGKASCANRKYVEAGSELDPNVVNAAKGKTKTVKAQTHNGTCVFDDEPTQVEPPAKDSAVFDDADDYDMADLDPIMGTEWGAKSGFIVYRSRVTKAPYNLTLEEVSEQWADFRKAQSAIARGADTPKTQAAKTAPKTSEGTMVKVSYSDLASLLRSMEGAEVVDGSATTTHVIVRLA